MSQSKFIAIIAVTLALFLMARGTFHLVCEPTPNNPVVAVVSEAISSSGSLSAPTKSNPLSWEPVLRSIVSLIAKVCPN